MPRKVKEEKIVFAEALSALCEAKNLPQSVVIDALSEAFRKAYYKESGDYPETVVRVDIDIAKGTIKMAKLKNVVADIQDDVFETDPEEAFEQTGIHYNVGDIMETPIDVSSFQRSAAMQVKGVFKQKLREAEKSAIAERFQDKVGTVIVGKVEVADEKHCMVRVGGTNNAYLPRNKMLPSDQFSLGDTIKLYVEEVDKGASGAPVIVSRVHPKFIIRLMEQEISEINEGIVEIRGISRQPGSRCKVAVSSKDPNIDPSGSCIGIHGSRIERVLSQIKPERIDVVNYSDNPLLYAADALKPAIVVGGVILDEETKSCRLIVTDESYSVAIGKEAQNVNLAVRLTGWKIDIKTVSAAEEAGLEYRNIEDIKFEDVAKRRAMNQTRVVRPVVTPKVVTPTETTTEAKPVEETISTQTPTVETPVVSKPRPTKTSVNVFSELEAALNGQTPTETKPVAKKKVSKKQDEEVEVEDTKKEQSPVNSNVLPVYTEEELAELEEQEQAEEASKYDVDEDIDYDEFDEYYDDEDVR